MRKKRCLRTKSTYLKAADIAHVHHRKASREYSDHFGKTLLSYSIITTLLHIRDTSKMSLVVPLIPLGPDPALLAPESAKDDIRRIAGDGGNTQDTVRELYRQYYEKKKRTSKLSKRETRPNTQRTRRPTSSLARHHRRNHRRWVAGSRM